VNHRINPGKGSNWETLQADRNRGKEMEIMEVDMTKGQDKGE
jgi:ribosomal protein S2